MDKIKKMFFIAIVDAIATQIFINIIPGGFRISLSVAILPAFYYINRELNPMYTALFISAVGMFFRVFVNINAIMADYTFYIADINIIVFDLVYGFIFYYFFYKSKNKDFFNWLMIVFFADLFANLSEILSRNVNVIDYLNKLIVVAFIRTLIAIGLVLIFYYFINIFKKEIDRKKYYDLLGIFSDIKLEVYLMKNNIKYIEDIMTEAYMLYDNIEKKDTMYNKKQALNIAQKVHEIKKNYLGILSGLSNVELDNNIYDDMMFLKILEILEKNTNLFIKENNEKIEFNIIKNENFYIKKHYYVMSILRNLINNSIESLIDCDKKNKKIVLSYGYDGDYLEISIFDNGKGIKEKNIDYIFNQGFSTKFTNDGKIHRGLGLTLVKKIVENEFHGEMSVSSNYTRFTKINLKLKLEKAKGEENAILYY